MSTVAAPVEIAPGELRGLLQMAGQAARLAIYVCDVESDGIRWFSSPAQLLGPADANGRYPPLSELVHPEDLPGWRKRTAMGEPTPEQDFRIIGTDGVERWLRAAARSLGGAGPRRRLLVVLQDVSEAKRAERWAQASETRLRDLLAMSSDWIWEQDEELRFSWLSEETLATAGSSSRSHYGLKRWELPGVVATDATWAAHRAQLEAREPFRDFVFRRLNEKGEETWISASGAPLYENGRFRGYRGVGRNITELKVARDNALLAWNAAELARSQLVTAIEALADGFVLYDAEDRLVLCNRRYREIYRASADLLVPGASFEEIIREGVRRGQYPEARDAPERWIEARLGAHRAVHSSIEQLTSDGVWLRIDESRTADGGVAGFRVDISDLKEATQRAQSASKAKSDFLAVMSHEMRTPLTAILGFAELALEQAASDGQRDDIQMIVEGGRRLLHLVNGVLEFSKIEAGKLNLDMVDYVPVAELLRLLQSLEPLAAAKGIRLRHEIDGGAYPGRVSGPLMALQQVLINLIGNAIKFTAQGEVAVTARLVRAEGAQIWIEAAVRDTGPGIGAKDLERLFEPFAQIDDTLTRQPGGTGLGLAISKRLIGMMNGEIRVESSPGAGALFCFEALIGSALDGGAREAG